MKTKTLSLSLAVIMSLQSIGYADTDRTEGIGQQAILSAQENLAAIQAHIVSLDQSLEAAANAIEKRDRKGGITNGIAVAGAAAGVIVGTLAYLTIKKGGEGSGIGGLILGAVSAGATLVSAVSGLSSQGLKTSVDTQELETQLQASQQNIEAAIAQSQDKATAVALMQLNVSLKGAQESLKQYQEEKTAETQTRLAAQAAQIAGIAITVYGLTQNQSSAHLIGPAIMATGNIISGVAGLDSEQAEAVLKEIKETREALKISAMALK